MIVHPRYNGYTGPVDSSLAHWMSYVDNCTYDCFDWGFALLELQDVIEEFTDEIRYNLFMPSLLWLFLG